MALAKSFKIQYLFECFDYEETTGKLFWKKNRPRYHFINDKGYNGWHTRYSGSEAGTIKKHRRTWYRNVWLSIQGESFYLKAHRIVLMLHHNTLLDGFICDHIDGNGLNNKLDNLKLTNDKGNSRNRRKKMTNKSGITGVSFNTQHQQWVVQIVCKEGRLSERYEDFFEACCRAKSIYNSEDFSPRHGL